MIFCNILHVLNFNLCSWKSNFYLDGMHWKKKRHKLTQVKNENVEKKSWHIDNNVKFIRCNMKIAWVYVLSNIFHMVANIQSNQAFELYQAEIPSFTYTLISPSTVRYFAKSDYKQCDEFIIHKSIGSQMRITEATRSMCCFPFWRVFLSSSPLSIYVFNRKDFTFKFPGECMRYSGWMKKKWIVSIVESIGSDSDGWKSSACSIQMNWMTKGIIEFAVHNVFNNQPTPCIITWHWMMIIVWMSQNGVYALSTRLIY